MVGRKDLRKSDRDRLEDAIQRAARAGRGATAPTGVIDLGDLGDLTWPDGAELRSVRDLPASITAVEDALAAGLSTTSKQNTVSSSAPSVTVGFPENAYWTQVGIVGGKRAVVGTWQLVSGTWRPVGEDASRLTVGQIDVGLLDVALIWAQMIETQTALINGPGIEVDRINLVSNPVPANTAGYKVFDPTTSIRMSTIGWYLVVESGTAACYLGAVADRVPVSAGTTHMTAGAEFYPTGTATGQISLLMYNAAGTLLAEQRSPVHTANTWGRVAVTMPVPAGTSYMVPRFVSNVQSPANSGSILRIGLITVTSGSNDGAYIAGNLDETSQYRYGWLGAQNASRSVRYRKITRPRLILDAAGLHYYDELGTEVVTLGTAGQNLISVGPASIDQKGNVTGTTGSFDKIMLTGQDMGALLAASGREQPVWGQRSSNTNWTTGVARLLEVTAALKPGRLYRIKCSPIRWESQTAGVMVAPRLEFFDQPWTTWGNAAMLQQTPVFTGAQLNATSPGMETHISTAGRTTVRNIGVIIRYDSGSAPIRAICGAANLVDLVVEDLGPAVPNTGQSWMDTSGSGSSAGAKVPFTLDVAATSWGTYARGGGLLSWADAPTQGSYNGADNREVIFLWPDLTAQLANADISRITVAAHATHWWYGAGGTGRWHVHGHTTLPAATGLTDSLLVAETAGWPRGATRQIDLPPGHFPQFKSGALRGIGFSTPSTALEYYGKFDPAPTIHIEGMK